MRCDYSCRSAEHVTSRRGFLGGLAGLGLASGFAPFIGAAATAAMAKDQKQMLVIWLAGGSSQLETWDPKPKTETGGPFRAIETSVPGIQICELLPQTAKQMHHMALVRGINTNENDHGKGQYLMHTGRAQTPGAEFPHLGSLAARFLAKGNEPLPGYIHITPGGGGVGGKEAAYLGPKYGALYLGNGRPPDNTARAGSTTTAADASRHDLRRHMNDRFANRRRTAETDAYTTTYEQALQLMERREVFDVTKEPASEQERYGSHDFGRHCLLARRLLEADATFVQVTHSNYDTHNENFAFHLEQLGEFDQGFSTLLDDLARRGRLDKTLVVVMSEFGRTPNINYLYGRDHWGTAWSIALAGCGIKGGTVVGKTNAKGTAVVDRQVGAGHLFHTYLKAVGLDPKEDYEVDGRTIQIADPTASPIKELLS
jgi:uncharacterized protein (DUF1501 family)